MLKGRNIICISSIDWDFVWQGHQEIMSTFAKEGNRVLYIENTGIRPPTFRDIPRIRKRITSWLKSVKGFRKENENLFIYSPLFLPFPYSSLAKWANRYLIIVHLKRWLEIMEFDNPIVWTFLPTGIAMEIIKGVRKKTLVYYYIADFDQLTRSSKKLKKTEEELMRCSDVIFAQGEHFRQRCLNFNKNVFVFPFGVNKDIFEGFKNAGGEAPPEDMQNIKKPIIGYVGGLHRHIDFGLIRYLAQTNPQWSVVLIGPAQVSLKDISGFENIYCLGKKDFRQLPAYINCFDVCIVPYLISGYTNTVYPTKINEYHIMGKPVVSTALPEVIKCNSENLIFIAKTYEEFSAFMAEAIKLGDDKNFCLLRIKSAEKNSWHNRINEMSNIIQDAIDKKSAPECDWREKFIKLYKKSRSKLIRISAAVSLLWFLTFYTPLLWFLSTPLKFSDALRGVDAIVVFAGGVGESGRAGQGYEEKVNYAVELYKKGFANKIIFSSGARSTFPEPYVMKALALSLGAGEGDIILEDKAASTYQNILFTKRILDAYGWNDIILITSPYHTRRAKLTFAKVAPAQNVIYTYAPYSEFYARSSVDGKGKKVWRQITFQQAKALFHEYIAICYYWLKRHI